MRNQVLVIITLASLWTCLSGYPAHINIEIPFEDAAYHPTIDSRLGAVIDGIAEGDTVDVRYPDSSLVRRFVLGEPLGEGSGGRVFRLVGEEKDKTVKFQKSGMSAKWLMKLQIAGMKQLLYSPVPHAVMYEWNSDLYVVTQFIDGQTLHEMCQQWFVLSPEVREKQMRALVRFVEILRSYNRRIWDLNWNNIVYSEPLDRWIIVDCQEIDWLSPFIGKLFEKVQEVYPHVYEEFLYYDLQRVKLPIRDPLCVRAVLGAYRLWKRPSEFFGRP